LSYLALASDIGLLFGVGLVASASLFAAFQRHLRHRFGLGTGFSVVMLVGMAGQFVAGVVPIGGTGIGRDVHVTAALTLGASIPVLMWRFAAEQPPGAWRRWCYRLLWLEVAASATGIVLSRNHVAPLSEILPAVVFHAWVAMTTFARTGDADQGQREAPLLDRVL